MEIKGRKLKQRKEVEEARRGRGIRRKRNKKEEE